MYCITSGSEVLVQDFEPYPDEFLFRDPSCLLRCTPVVLKDLTTLHIGDAYDDNLVAEEIAFNAHTRTQTRAADAAKFSDDPIILTTSSDDQTEKSIYKIAPPPPRAKIAPPPPRAFAATTDEIALSDDLVNHNEVAIARLFSRRSVEFVLSPHSDQM